MPTFSLPIWQQISYGRIIFRPCSEVIDLFYTLKSKLLLAFSLLLVIPFLSLVIIVTEQSKANVETIIQTSSSQTIAQYAEYLNMLGGQVEDVAFQILSSSLIQQWIAARNDQSATISQTERYLLNARVEQLLSQVVLSQSNIATVSLHDRTGFVISNGSVYEHLKYDIDTDWYQYVLHNGPNFALAHFDPYQSYTLEHTPVNSLVFPLVELSTLTIQGAIKVNIPSALIEQPLENMELEQWRTIQLVDQNGILVTDTSQDKQLWLAQQQQTWTSLLDEEQKQHFLKTTNEQGKQSYWFYYKLNNPMNWMIVGEITEKQLFGQIDRMRRTMLLIGAGLLLLSLIAAYLISASMTKPLSKLSQMMRRLEMGNFNIADNLQIARKGETGYLLYTFSRMANQLNQLIRDEFTLKLRKRDAEYKALRMQVNPHFLYNTLETIGSLAAQQKTEQLLDVTESLGQMMRHSLKQDSDSIPLTEELQQIDYYISIMKTRFEDHLLFQVDFDASLTKATIMKFILQPLIENALKYSNDALKQATVELTIQRLDQMMMRISIKDNGIGMSEQQIIDLLTSIEAEHATELIASSGERIGLKNVLVRCKLYYGENFRVAISSRQQQGTTIMLTLPIHEGLN